MAESENKSNAKKPGTSSSKKEREAKAERATAGKPITQSGLSGISQDDLNPAFAPPKD